MLIWKKQSTNHRFYSPEVPPSNPYTNRRNSPCWTTDARLAVSWCTWNIGGFQAPSQKDLRLSLSNKFAPPNGVNHRFCGVKIRINSIHRSLHGLFFRVEGSFCFYFDAKVTKSNSSTYHFSGESSPRSAFSFVFRTILRNRHAKCRLNIHGINAKWPKKEATCPTNMWPSAANNI